MEGPPPPPRRESGHAPRCQSSLRLGLASGFRVLWRAWCPTCCPLLRRRGSSAPIDCSWKVLASSRAFYKLVLVLVLGWLPLRICALVFFIQSSFRREGCRMLTSSSG
ncbi:uncharacterized protein LOC124678212 isoform X2 [Lolium rigidum]|uniref:uncharacterized protein LOC124678212 isoform X2 n=1 Tax=Lolium rigidum TaxID=89674 RepID=UPI001F5D5890|nr:uncharacterized protein LOC124678212 isoform X2 [Lolium rigidum]